MNGRYASKADNNEPKIEQFPVLPKGMERSGFIQLFHNVAQSMFGLNDAEIYTFTSMAEDARPSAWKRTDMEPCCWRRQGEVANRRRKSRFSIARHERTLVKVGLVEKRTMAHGGRSGYAGCGIYFSKAINLVQAMIVHQAKLDAQAAERNILCNTRSVHKGHCKSALIALTTILGKTSEIAALWADFKSWPDARSLRRVDLSALRELVKEADQQTQSVLMRLEKTENMQHAGGTNATPFIQDTTQDLIYVCNAGVDKLPDCKQPGENLGAKLTGSANYLEKNDGTAFPHHKNAFHIKLGGQTILDLCSENMKFYLRARMGAKAEPNAHDLDCAVQQMLPELGIKRSAWVNACETMGRDRATMCVIITDANTDHPHTPVRCPGAYLRGMTSAFCEGDLNILGSLIALSERRSVQQICG